MLFFVFLGEAAPDVFFREMAQYERFFPAAHEQGLEQLPRGRLTHDDGAERFRFGLAMTRGYATPIGKPAFEDRRAWAMG